MKFHFVAALVILSSVACKQREYNSDIETVNNKNAVVDSYNVWNLDRLNENFVGQLGTSKLCGAVFGNWIKIGNNDTTKFGIWVAEKRAPCSPNTKIGNIQYVQFVIPRGENTTVGAVQLSGKTIADLDFNRKDISSLCTDKYNSSCNLSISSTGIQVNF